MQDDLALALVLKLFSREGLAAIKAAAPTGLTFTYGQMLDEQHGTIYHRAALDALRLVFANPPEPAR